MTVKHVGQLSNGSKVLVAMRTLPGEPTNALVIPTAALKQTYHDELDSLVMKDESQQAYEFATILNVRKFSDGSTMLPSLHSKGLMKKVSTSEITMTPATTKDSWLQLDELNKIIAEQRGVGIDELALTANGEPGKTAPIATANEEPAKDGILSDEDLATQYRAQADQLYKEVQNLRKQADDLSPKKTSAKKTTKTNA
jgi:Zn-finger nucleic acid-binding protein